jgi:hypothetical protein
MSSAELSTIGGCNNKSVDESWRDLHSNVATESLAAC